MATTVAASVTTTVATSVGGGVGSSSGLSQGARGSMALITQVQFLAQTGKIGGTVYVICRSFLWFTPPFYFLLLRLSMILCADYAQKQEFC